ncbi:Gfo/Idh/MocA family oxidoreductase [Occallatibacter savannae]|uniref:Gfo/Idh/MocA family oxidoreductase n=1 Tax=Occallatibacter savannae TaxID=1002691 RepID=UPI000D68A194|nr:Gfo/Idh/MocA family oxidoreductase [Occallatibacter savannae]
MIRVGVVGFGLAGRVFHAPLISSVEGLELAAVVERSSNNAAERYPGITTYRSVDELLADASIKLVVVATPNASHFSIAMQALEAAKNVVVDKPVALTSDEIRQLSELAGGIGLQLFPFHNRRFDSDFQTLRKVLDEHHVGRNVHLESNFDRWRPGLTRRPWKEDQDQGGLLFDIGTHLVDQTLVLFGLPASVGCDARRERDGDGATDSFSIRLHYLTGFSATLNCNLLSSLARSRFHLRGTRGNFWKWGLDPQEDALTKITKIEDPAWGQEQSDRWGTLSVGLDGDPVETRVPSLPGNYRRFYVGVRDALLGTLSPDLATATDAWRGARILEWARQSAEEHRDIECDWSSEPA